MANVAVRSGVASVLYENFSKVASADLDCIPSSTGGLRHLPGRRPFRRR
jgi:hypothetical protein